MVENYRESSSLISQDHPTIWVPHVFSLIQQCSWVAGSHTQMVGRLTTRRAVTGGWTSGRFESGRVEPRGGMKMSVELPALHRSLVGLKWSMPCKNKGNGRVSKQSPLHERSWIHVFFCFSEENRWHRPQPAVGAPRLFYIGGCASSADLMSCQGTDGGLSDGDGVDRVFWEAALRIGER